MSRKRTPEETITCRTPNGGKAVTIDAWKYFVVRQAILRAVSGPQKGILFMELPDFLTADLAEKAKALGDVSWYATTVKMEMEVREELVRSKKGGRQWLTQGPKFPSDALTSGTDVDTSFL